MKDFVLAVLVLVLVAVGLIAIGVVSCSELDDLVKMWEERDDGED